MELYIISKLTIADKGGREVKKTKLSYVIYASPLLRYIDSAAYNTLF